MSIRATSSSNTNVTELKPTDQKAGERLKALEAAHGAD
jgi:hypothetical protein